MVVEATSVGVVQVELGKTEDKHSRYMTNLRRKIRDVPDDTMWGEEQRFSFEDLKRLYEDKGLSIRQIGRLLGREFYSDYKTRLLLERAGIQFRTEGRGYRVAPRIPDRYEPPMLTEADIEEDFKTRIFK